MKLMKFTVHKMRIKIFVCVIDDNTVDGEETRHKMRWCRVWREMLQFLLTWIFSIFIYFLLPVQLNQFNLYRWHRISFSSATSTSTTIECHFRSLVSSFKENSFTFAFRHSSFLKWLLEIHRDINKYGEFLVSFRWGKNWNFSYLFSYLARAKRIN